MSSSWRSVVRAGTILLYCWGAVVAPAIHHGFHRDDHIHVGDSIVYLGAEMEQPATAEEQAIEDHARHHHHHQQQHQHPHDRPDHGANSLWHSGAAISDHLDRTPALPADAEFSWLPPVANISVTPLRSRNALRLRGPPQRVAA